MKTGHRIDKVSMNQLQQVFLQMDTGMLQEVLWVIEEIILCRRKKCLTSGVRCERSIVYDIQELSFVNSVNSGSKKNRFEKGKG